MDGNVIKENLTDRQRSVIPHLLASASIEEGCKRARVGKATLYDWLKQEAFRGELGRRRKEIVELAIETLKANVTKAAQTLVKHLDSEKENISIRAAERIIEFAQRAMEEEDLQQRIQTLEETIKERG